MIAAACALFAAASLPAEPLALDGVLRPVEWRRVNCEAVGGFAVLMRLADGRLEIATKATGDANHITEIAIRRAGGEVLTLHASAQLGQRVHPAGAEPPPWQWSNNRGWSASRVEVSRIESGGWRIGRYDGQEMMLEPDLLRDADKLTLTIHAFDPGEVLVTVPLSLP